MSPDSNPHVARITALAQLTLGSPEATQTWLERPMHALDGRTPLQASQSEDGAHQVERILLQAEHGMLG